MEREATDPAMWWRKMLHKYPEMREHLGFVLGFVTAATMIIHVWVVMVPSDYYHARYYSYSLALTAVDGFGHGQPPAGPGATPPLSPAFNFTLYAENSRMLVESCFSHAEVALSYDGVAMGGARVPGWCAGPRSTAEAKAVARGGGHQLPGSLRKRLEAELRWGSAELNVEARLFRDDMTRSPVLLWCKAVGPQLPPQPLQCKAFVAF